MWVIWGRGSGLGWKSTLELIYMVFKALRKMGSSKCGCGWKRSLLSESWFPPIFRGQRDEKEATKKQIGSSQEGRQTTSQVEVLGAK